MALFGAVMKTQAEGCEVGEGNRRIDTLGMKPAGLCLLGKGGVSESPDGVL